MRLLSWVTLLAAALLTGCAEDAVSDDADATVDDGDDVGREIPLQESECEPFTNYGVYLGVGDHYVITEGGAAVAVYEESNGRGGLQTEDSCPDDPDTRVL